MFVRFRKTKATHGSDYSLKVDIVRSRRVKGSASRAEIIAYIGSFKVRDWKYKERGYCEAKKLWEKADKVFKKLRFGIQPITAEEEVKERAKFLRASRGAPELRESIEPLLNDARTGTPPQITAKDEAKLRQELEARIPKPPQAPRVNWCNPKTWPNLYAFSPHGYKPKP